jgi:hypothetical protein
MTTILIKEATKRLSNYPWFLRIIEEQNIIKIYVKKDGLFEKNVICNVMKNYNKKYSIEFDSFGLLT